MRSIFQKKFKEPLLLLLISAGIGLLIYELRIGVSGLSWQQSNYDSVSIEKVAQYAGDSTAWKKWIRVPHARIEQISPIAPQGHEYTCLLIFDDQSRSDTCKIKTHKVDNGQKVNLFWEIKYKHPSGKKHEWSQVMNIFAMNENSRITFSFFWDAKKPHWIWQLHRVRTMIQNGQATIDDFHQNIKSYKTIGSSES